MKNGHKSLINHWLLFCTAKTFYFGRFSQTQKLEGQLPFLQFFVHQDRYWNLIIPLPKQIRSLGWSLGHFVSQYPQLPLIWNPLLSTLVEHQYLLQSSPQSSVVHPLIVLTICFSWSTYALKGNMQGLLLPWSGESLRYGKVLQLLSCVDGMVLHGLELHCSDCWAWSCWHCWPPFMANCWTSLLLVLNPFPQVLEHLLQLFHCPHLQSFFRLRGCSSSSRSSRCCCCSFEFMYINQRYLIPSN